VLRAGGHLLTAVIARDDSPGFSAYWPRPATNFDAEDAPRLLAQVFAATTLTLGRPVVTLPTSTAIRDYLIGRQAPDEVADTACREMAVPCTSRSARAHPRHRKPARRIGRAVEPSTTDESPW